MGEENKVTVNEETTVADIVSEETAIVETEENSSSRGFKEVAGIAAVTTVMLGAGYGLYKLGRVVVGKAKEAYIDHKAKKYIDSLEDDEFDDEPIEEAPVEQKPEFPDHKKKQK